MQPVEPSRSRLVLDKRVLDALVGYAPEQSDQQIHNLRQLPILTPDSTRASRPTIDRQIFIECVRVVVVASALRFSRVAFPAPRHITA